MASAVTSALDSFHYARNVSQCERFFSRAYGQQSFKKTRVAIYREELLDIERDRLHAAEDRIEITTQFMVSVHAASDTDIVIYFERRDAAPGLGMTRILRFAPAGHCAGLYDDELCTVSRIT